MRKKGRYSGYAPWKDKDKLEKKYLIEKKSIGEIAKEWNTTRKTISVWLKEHEIKTRSISAGRQLQETRKKMSEAKMDSRNPNWKGGKK